MDYVEGDVMSDNRWSVLSAVSTAVGTAIGVVIEARKPKTPDVDTAVRLALLEKRVEELEKAGTDDP